MGPHTGPFFLSMQPLPEIFLRFARLYKEHGFSLYMIGGTSRDYLLGLPCLDFDFVTDATPEEEKAFLPEANYHFERFGTIKAEGCDITTLRYEEDYVDHRHPGKVRFIKDLSLDSCRRDFTINALYIDAEGKVYDFHGGLEDLRQGIIRFIGDPAKRIKEDPLRILRAHRFAKRLQFHFDPKTEEALVSLADELSKINPDKVLMEKKKE